MIPFAEFAPKYLDYSNHFRTTDPAAIALELGPDCDVNVIREWQVWTNAFAVNFFNEHQNFPTVDQIVQGWDKAHPKFEFVMKTPFGEVGFTDKPVASCSAKELAEVIATAVVRALGK